MSTIIKKELQESAEKIIKEVTEQLVNNLYENVQDVNQVAKLLKIPLEEVQALLHQ